MKIVDKLKHLISCEDAKSYIDQLGIELVIDTSEVDKELDRAQRLISELRVMGVKLVDVGTAKFAGPPKKFPLIADCDYGLVLVDHDGVAIPGQMSLNINSPIGDKVTADVTLIIGGVYSSTSARFDK